MGRRKHGLGLRVAGDVVRLRNVCRILLALCKDLRAQGLKCGGPKP